ncbi:serine protease [Lyophyllum atratum]|nr:serine protease [Lyophyllum atratum]
MRVFIPLLAAITLIIPVSGTPAPLRTIEKFIGKTSGKYIVMLKDGVPKDRILARLSHANITNDWTLIHGFAGHFSPEAVNALRASPDVEHISEDGIVQISEHVVQCDQRSLGCFTYRSGLSDSKPPYLVFSHLLTSVAPAKIVVSAFDYDYPYEAPAGRGVDVYVVDSGIRTSHIDFGGRARWGATFGGYADTDGNGHGTHVAGTVGGRILGVAKDAAIIAVRVFSDAGSGPISDVMSGLEYVANSATASGRPSVANLSLGGGASTALDSSVQALVAKGVHTVVAAGNSNVDAGTTSPARVPEAITVGAATIYDSRASFSNYGSVVDVFAPGQDIISCWNTADNDIALDSGTSMAAPHVAGLVAYLIGKQGNMTPAAMSDLIKNRAIKGVLSDVPSGTINNMIQNV